MTTLLIGILITLAVPTAILLGAQVGRVVPALGELISAVALLFWMLLQYAIMIVWFGGIAMLVIMAAKGIFRAIVG